MASKRAVKRRACTSKIRYVDRESAIKARLALVRDKPHTQSTQAYRCPHCHGWHIGRWKQKYREERFN